MDNVEVEGLDFTNATAESTKIETTLTLNAFGTTQNYTDLQALAKRIQSIILMEPGTNPANIEMGVGIRNFVTEFMDDTTLTRLSRITLDQVNRFIPTQLVKDITYGKGSGIYSGFVFCYVNINMTSQEFEQKVLAISFNSSSPAYTTTIQSEIFI
jgi:hypothetical protein